MREHRDQSVGEAAMNPMAMEAFDNAAKLYEQYARLAELNDLAQLGAVNAGQGNTVSAVTATLCENYSNAVVG
jgi:hypothetical protein